jgi:hypothetical protein
MPTSPKILGQSAPAAATVTTLYTCGSTGGAVVSSLTICNTGTTGLAVNVSAVSDASADAPSQAVYRNLVVAPSDTFVSTIGMALATGGRITVSTTLPTASFTLFGTENS